MSDDLPIGTIMAFAGPFGPRTTDDLWYECDGMGIQNGGFPDLYAIIGTAFGSNSSYYFLPELSGYFLRGVSHDSGVDPDADSRTAIDSGGNTGNKVGSVQATKSGAPKIPFCLDTQPGHSHAIAHSPFTDWMLCSIHATPVHFGGGGFSVTSDPAGAHTHTLTGGGDAETRPANVNIKWYIKASDSNGAS